MGTLVLALAIGGFPLADQSEEYVVVDRHSDGHPSRRAFLAVGAATALAVAVSTGSPAYAGGKDVSARLRELEREHAARLGVFARNTVTGKTVAYRADERFPMCSVFKTLAAATVLRDLDQHGEVLTKRIRYTEQDVTGSGYAPITATPDNLTNGLTIAELCAAAISYSDNTAANLLLRELGGPSAITRFSRSIGDDTTRLDRWEPDLNTGEPGREEDTTSPRAIGHSYDRLVLGNALNPQDQQLLTTWLLGNTTSGETFRAGLPSDWALADKTGSGGYGTRNDVGVTWTPAGVPIVMAVLTTHQDPDAKSDNPLVAKTAAVLTATLA